jgi:hypothetical protein
MARLKRPCHAGMTIRGGEGGRNAFVATDPVRARCFAPLQIDVEVAVNEKLLGGLQVQIGDRFLDLSVASRVASLTQTLDSSM